MREAELCFSLSFLWLSVQVAGVLYSILKVKYDVDPGLTPFDLFDYTTWSGPEWLYMVGFAIYFLALFIFSIYYKWPSYLLNLLGIGNAGIRCAGVCRWSDSGLRLYSAELLGIFVKMVLEIYLGLMAYLSIFGVLTFIAPFKDYNGAQPSAAGSGGGGGGTSAGASRMPGSIQSVDGTTYYLRQNLGYGWNTWPQMTRAM